MTAIVGRKPKLLKAEHLVAEGKIDEITGYVVRAWRVAGGSKGYIVTTLHSPSGDLRGTFCNCRVVPDTSCSHMIAARMMVERELDPFRGLPLDEPKR